MKTLQIATFGQNVEGIYSGLCYFPVHKLIIFHNIDQSKEANEFADKIRSTLKIPASLRNIWEKDTFQSVTNHLFQILREEINFEMILLNVSAGNKTICSAALTAAFSQGIQAFDVDSNGYPVLFPRMTVTFDRIISKAKIDILKAIDEYGGSISGLSELVEITGLGKSLLSFHVFGTRDNKGLTHLGFVNVERVKHGKVNVSLTPYCKMFLSQNSNEQSKDLRIVEPLKYSDVGSKKQPILAHGDLKRVMMIP